jgi:AcrR family transcriptional regulator
MASRRPPAASPAPKRRGRPAKYQADTALSDARDAFWRTGFAGTSLDDLAASMKMNRPSVYAAFGDKEALYIETVRRYAAASTTALAAALESELPLREVLEAVYASSTDFYLLGSPDARGCYLVGTAVTESVPKAEVREVVEATFDEFARLFERRFRHAAKSGELPAGADTKGLALIATSVLNAISLRARTGASRRTLKALATATVRSICRTE